MRGTCACLRTLDHNALSYCHTKLHVRLVPYDDDEFLFGKEREVLTMNIEERPDVKVQQGTPKPVPIHQQNFRRSGGRGGCGRGQGGRRRFNQGLKKISPWDPSHNRPAKISKLASSSRVVKDGGSKPPPKA